jgi:Zn-finger nucleic acid-binding protein
MSQFFDPTGYNRADQQFHERDEQLLRELRGKLDARRRETQQANAKNEHWMRCPKCGGQLKEVVLSGSNGQHVNVDQCTACGGVYFDAGELALLIGREPGARGTIERLFSWLPRYQEAVELLWPEQPKRK